MESPFQNFLGRCHLFSLSGHLLEVRGGYFYPQNSTLRKVYNRGGVDLQLASSNDIWKRLQLYESLEYIRRNGHSLVANQSTSMRIVTLSFGLKYPFQIASCADYYLSLGPRYFFVRVNNHSQFVDKHFHQNGLGGFLGMGFLFHLRHNIAADLFSEYSYKRMHFHPSKTNVIGETVQIGGFCAGLGIGYFF